MSTEQRKVVKYLIEKAQTALFEIVSFMKFASLLASNNKLYVDLKFIRRKFQGQLLNFHHWRYTPNLTEIY